MSLKLFVRPLRPRLVVQYEDDEGASEGASSCVKLDLSREYFA